MKVREWTREDGRVFPVLIDERAFREWQEQRPLLAIREYPDRPPDIDTPTTRQWVVHPDEPGFTEFAELVPKDRDSGPHRVIVLTWEDVGLVLKFLSSRHGHDRYSFRVAIMDSETGQQRDVAEMEDTDLATLEREADTFRIFKGSAGAGAPRVLETTPADFARSDRLAEEVARTLSEWYREHPHGFVN